MLQREERRDKRKVEVIIRVLSFHQLLLQGDKSTK